MDSRLKVCPNDKSSQDLIQQQGYLFLFSFSGLFIIFSMLVCPLKEILIGLKAIMFSSSILISDFSTIGNCGSAFFNSGCSMLFCTVLLKIYKREFCESAISAILSIGGYSFFGKNIYCLIPIIFGVFLYAKLMKKDFSELILVGFFGGALSPVVNHLSFSINLAAPYSIIIAYTIGMLLGFLLPILTKHFFHFHKGNSLYSVGFATGILGIVILNVLKVMGLEPKANQAVFPEPNELFSVCLLVTLSLLFVFGFILERFDLTEIRKFSSESGPRVSNQLAHCGLGLTLMNMSFIGFLLVLIIFVLRIPINGILFGTVIAVIGYCARGINLRSVAPILLGAITVFSLVPDYSADRIEVIMALIFSIGLSPITTKYGQFWGFVAGMFHVTIAPAMSSFHGGLNLYNSGLASGLVAGFLYPVIDALDSRGK